MAGGGRGVRSRFSTVHGLASRERSKPVARPAFRTFAAAIFPRGEEKKTQTSRVGFGVRVRSEEPIRLYYNLGDATGIFCSIPVYDNRGQLKISGLRGKVGPSKI